MKNRIGLVSRMESDKIMMEEERLKLPKDLSEEEMDENLLLEDQEQTKDLSKLDMDKEYHWRKNE